MPAWAQLLEGLFAKKGTHEMKASKACRKAVKAAAASSSKGTDKLAASLQAFLGSGDGGFRLEGGMVVRAQPPRPAAHQAAGGESKKDKKQQKREAVAAAAAVGERPPTVAAAVVPVAEAAAAHKEKKKKERKEKKEKKAAEQQQQQQQAMQAPPHAADGEGSKKKLSCKRKEQAQEEAQDVQQPPAAAEQGQEQPSSKKWRKQAAAGAVAAAAGRPAAAAAAAEGGGGGAEVTSWDDVDVEHVKWREDVQREEVKSGPYSKAEKDTLRQAVHDYAAAKGLPTDDWSWLYATSRSAENKGMWKKVASKLPHRTAKSVWAAGTRMFHEGNYLGPWTADEDDQLMRMVNEIGRRWKEIGGAVGRMPEACRDRWLSIRLGDDKRRGRWSPEEEEKLRQAVADYQAAKQAASEADAAGGGGEGEATLSLEDLTGAAAEEAGGGGSGGARSRTCARRVVLDDIDWNVVSLAVGTRSNVQCLEKWYDQLSPSMVDRGDWGQGDDRRLLRALYRSGAAHEFELEWGALVKDRTAAQTRRRWRLMLKSLQDHRDMEFPEQVEELVERYLPQLKEGQQAQQPGQQMGDA